LNILEINYRQGPWLARIFGQRKTRESQIGASEVIILKPELIKDGVVKVDASSIGTKFENFVQSGCRDLGSHRSRNVYCRKPIILPNLVLFFGTFLELPVLPSITCGFDTKPRIGLKLPLRLLSTCCF